LEKNSKRLESIKAAHTIKKVASTTREEDYLEVIAELVELKGYATTLDISRFMNVSPPSVTKMLQKLDEKKYLEYEKYHGINLTNMGKQVADTIRRKHSILLEFFEILNGRFRTSFKPQNNSTIKKIHYIFKIKSKNHKAVS